MKFCSQCGTELPESGGFCPNCGKPINPPAAEPVPAEPVYAAPAAFEPAPAEVPVPVPAPVPTPAPEPPVYTAPSVTVNVNAPNRNRPVGQLKTNRTLLKYIFLGLVTLGIYDIVVMSTLTTDLNVLASRYDGKRTMHLFPASFLTGLTLGIYGLVWNHKLCNRMGDELSRRGINYKISSGTFWGWGFFGSLILVGPFIYMHKVLKSMNLLCEHYNENG